MKRLVRTFLLAAAGAGLVLALAGCSGLHADRAEPQVYALRFQPPAAAPGAGTAPPPAASEGATLQVLRPLAAPGLDDDHITLLREGQKLDHYAGGRWAGPLPEVLQQLAIEALRARGGYRSVLGDAVPLAAGQVLQLEIARCTAVYAGAAAPEVQVRLVASFGRRDDRSLIATQLLEARVMAADNRMGAVAAAFEQALNQALAQLAPPAP